MANINTTLINQLKPRDKPYDVRDDKLTGFMVRVNISGKMLYMCEYERGKRMTIGKVGVLSPIQARDKAKELLADAVRGADPGNSRKQAKKASTLGAYIEHDYKPWAESNLKYGRGTIERLMTHFGRKLGGKLLSEITPWLIEQWRTQRLKGGIKPVTLNRDIATLKSAMNKAVEWGKIEANPLVAVKMSKIDNSPKVRYLDFKEEKQLRQALSDREQQFKESRERGNRWRQERGYPEMPTFHQELFVDYLKPMILISLNTGLRQGELFNLQWRDIDFSRAMLTVVGATAKSGKTRHIPLNSEVLDILSIWRRQVVGDGLVFTNNNQQRFTDVKKAWATLLKRANIQSFRWHDMRHHFASSLVMAGVDLNTVRELLGHSDIKMTLRYAHLAPEHKAEAVARLVRREWINPSNKNFVQNQVATAV